MMRTFTFATLGEAETFAAEQRLDGFLTFVSRMNSGFWRVTTVRQTRRFV